MDEKVIRINKFLSNAGFCSRKETNRLIEENRIKVNKEYCNIGQWIKETDEILVDDKVVPVKKKVYIVLNKPVGVTCTAAREVKNNIIDFINYPDYIFPVGRLDKDSEGLILMTNDGELASTISDAANEHEKEYLVTVDKPFEDEFMINMSAGVEIFGVKTRPCKVIRVDKDTFRIILSQGLNRQIRKMTKAFGYNVISLKRIRILNIKIDGLETGSWRNLTENEMLQLRKQT
ncbi:23S rRNA pseudouridine2604 synthase [Clostridium grantii DSM 8605]|uniref:Pseudouridine synthase n=1 Tax=Clostridium grantii DSM 8605 TaxID=1121316 RepID=A0A1M5VYY3_9CLOT|nr:23S rRNA pseudouridine2604 synthase [Clostridium grantii DSM 8605]